MLQHPAGRVAQASLSLPQGIQPVPLLALLLLTGCAYVGSPVPPLANIPARVTDLAAVQRATRIIVHYSLPAFTTEAMAIKPPIKLDLRSGAAGENPDQFQAMPEGTPGKGPENGVVTQEIPIDGFIGKQAAIAVRTIGANGKASAWSDTVTLPVVPAPPAPADVKAANAPEYGKHYAYRVQRIVRLEGGREAESDPSQEAGVTTKDEFPPAIPGGLHASAAPDSVELTWDQDTDADLAGYRVYRAVPGGAFERIAEVTPVPAYSDHAVEHGKTYRY